MLLVIGSVSGQMSAEATPLKDNTGRLWQKYYLLPADSLEKAVDLLFELQKGYTLQMQASSADSVSHILMDRVRMSGDEALIVSTMYRWFTNLDVLGLNPTPFADTASVVGFARRMLSIAKKNNRRADEGKAWYAFARYRLAAGDYKGASEDMNRAWYAASLTDDKELQIRCLLLIGYCEEFQQAKLAAFRHYSDALYIARELYDPQLLARCYEQMFDFYFSINNWGKAEDYVYKTLPLLLQTYPVDSVALMHQLSNLTFLQCSLKEYDAALRTAQCVLDYSIRNGTNYLKKTVLAAVKSVLIEHGEYQRLKNFYLNHYTHELTNTASTDPAAYYQLKAAFAEADNVPDSAGKYYELARNEILAKPRSAGAIAFYLRRFGKFLLHSGQPERAITTLDSALGYATKAEYLPYMAELSGLLDSLYALKRDSGRAYQYAQLNKEHIGRLTAANRQDEILALDLENEIRTREMLAQQEEERTRHRHNVQYMAITLLIGICFTILVMLGVFKVTRWLISAMGFISFILLFEFIILIIDHKVHELTHGEPWMVLGIKITIIAGLLPFHHWLEHKVVHYLHQHPIMAGTREKLRPMIQRLRNIFRKKAKAPPQAGERPPSVKPLTELPRPAASTSKTD
jgi:hypothetical protein